MVNTILESKINQIIRDVINETVVDKFTPYTPEERERNFRGIGRMGNPSYDMFMDWKREGLSRGIPKEKLTYAEYRRLNPTALFDRKPNY